MSGAAVRVLLAAARGGGGIVLPLPAVSEVALTTAPEGGWQGLTGAGAIQADGVVYVSWVDGTNGDVGISSFDDATGAAIDSFVLHAALERDWHDSPAVAILPSGRLIVAYSKHSGTTIFVRVSTNAGDISAWGAEASIDAQLGGAGYTYPSLFVEPGGTVWLFYRTDGPNLPLGNPSSWQFSTSTDNGTTWAPQTLLFKNANASRLSYMVVDFDGIDRFDFAVTDGVYNADDADVYHFSMTTAGAASKSDGTSISLPLDETDCTLVHDGGTSNGSRSPVAIRAGARPVFTYPAPSSLNSDGSRTGSAEDWYYARWDGSAWSTHNVVSDGGTTEAWIEGGFAPEHGRPEVAWLSRQASGRYEVFRYRTLDGGATWSSEMVSSSPSEDFYPVAVRNPRRTRAVWCRGTATDATDYSLAIVAGITG